MARLLGASFQLNSFQTWFNLPHSLDKIFLFLDPSHLLKIIRNVLGEKLNMIDKNNNIISWEYVRELHRLQDKEGLHLANKLRSVHINFFKQKMKVRLAAQTFSKSVADALQFCKDDLKLKEFHGCEATIYFIRLMNDLFDIFNSRNMKQYGYKAPLHHINKDIVFQKLDECLQYLKELKDNHGNLLIQSRRNVAFLGFCISITSLKELYSILCEGTNLSLNYLCTYKFSQDHVELLFGVIRSQFGNNNNPSARQFQSAMKKILTHLELTPDSSGNCVPLKNINILQFATSSKAKNFLFDDSLYNDDNININNEDDIILDSNTNILTKYSRSVISYISGFIVKFKKKTIHCTYCIDALTELPKDIYNHELISIKDEGGLLYPSNDVILICEKCEKLICMIIKENNSKYLHPKYNVQFFLIKILSSLVEQNTIFSKLREHSLDHIGTENHIVYLIRAIAEKYIKIRLHYICKNLNEFAKSDRHRFNKIILFKGQ